MRLKPAQAEALRELQEARGLVAQLGVGEGKTLVTQVAPELLRAQRPVAVLPAKLISEAEAEHVEYRSRGWRVRLPKLVSYTALGLRQNDNLLDEEDPDLLMLDEAWNARNVDAACTRKLGEWISANPQCVVAVLGGTLITANMLDYQHLMVWALKDRAPVPLMRSEAERWADTVTDSFHQHLRTRRGVVTSSGASCDASIEIGWWRPDLSSKVRKLLDFVQETMLRPDGEPLSDVQYFDCQQQLAGGGFYYVWDPLPPEDWLAARRAWHRYERAVRDERIPGLESTARVEDALDREDPAVPYGETGRDLLSAWRAIRPTFTPNKVPVWVDDSVLAQAVEHAGPDCLIWTRHEAAGERLRDRYGVPWYPGGTIPPRHGRTIALSIDSQSVGRNLQAWRRNLVLTTMATPGPWEQLIGRTHRQGQKADLVEVDIIQAIDYHRNTMYRVKAEARKDGNAADLEQRLIRATWRRN